MTLVEHAFRRLSEAPGVERVLVATDDVRVVETVKAFGGEAVMTAGDHATGSDRAAEAVRGVSGELVVNLQLDQPFLSPRAIGEAVSALRRSPSYVMSTLVKAVALQEAQSDEDGVTVAVTPQGRALYFSRGILPPQGVKRNTTEAPWVWQHIGLYCYRREFLLGLSQRERSPLERAEGLEQLRVLEEGEQILAVPTSEFSFCLHRPEELSVVEPLLMEQQGTAAGRGRVSEEGV
jgi:3-deoxy-manno-octulosonate cytidylyltransferase (CMP-KDO synthetase)